MTQNLFLYFFYFALFGSATQFALSLTPLSRAPSPELARRSMRTTAAYSLALGIPIGVLGLGESFRWFAEDADIKLIFMVGGMVVEGLILFLYVRAMRPIANELKQIREQSAK